MAIVSTKGEYGLTAVLILARQKDKELLQTKEIAKAGDIPQNYLEQILVVLKKSGLVMSIRGASGGYKLAKDPNNITVFDVLQSLECCFAQTDSSTDKNILQPFWEDTQKKVEKIFQITISELEEFLEKDSSNLVYYI
ncbi:MAG: Rrf2 family transcriptional regulator [Arcobacteraceae bacterium]|nr:Rrf2 family transcriptional regulator [Arcobacteraceae bacterium]